MRIWRVRSVCLLLVAVLSMACGSGYKEDPMLQFSAEEALEMGKELMENRKYAQSRKYFVHAFEVEPNSATGREALLLAADAYYLAGGVTNYIQAEAKYRDFLNRFPTSDRAAYVQFQMANCLAGRMEKPDRDQKVTLQAREAYFEVLRLYPTSDYASRAEEQIAAVNEKLADHDFGVGRFYLRYGLPQASITRFNDILDHFPEYSNRDRVLFFLHRAYAKAGEPEKAEEIRARLEQNHPDSEFVQRLPKE